MRAFQPVVQRRGFCWGSSYFSLDRARVARAEEAGALTTALRPTPFHMPPLAWLTISASAPLINL